MPSWNTIETSAPALREVSRHTPANVLDELQRRLRPRAKRALHNVMYAPTKTAETSI